MKYIILTLFSVLCLLNIFDIYSTNILLSNGLEESNPFVKYVIDITGSLIGISILKGIFLIILFKGCLAYYRSKVLLISLSIVVSWYLVGMCVFNLPALINL